MPVGHVEIPCLFRRKTKLGEFFEGSRYVLTINKTSHTLATCLSLTVPPAYFPSTLTLEPASSTEYVSAVPRTPTAVALLEPLTCPSGCLLFRDKSSRFGEGRVHRTRLFDKSNLPYRSRCSPCNLNLVSRPLCSVLQVYLKPSVSRSERIRTGGHIRRRSTVRLF